MVALGRKYDTGIFLSPTKETCFLYLYTCYLDEDYVPRYARNCVLYQVKSVVNRLRMSPNRDKLIFIKKLKILRIQESNCRSHQTTKNQGTFVQEGLF